MRKDRKETSVMVATINTQYIADEMWRRVLEQKLAVTA